MFPDQRLRALERRAAAGEEGASAELLLERHRRDDLPEERLRLAAHLGDPGAVLAAQEILGVVPRRQNLGTWIRKIGKPNCESWGRELPWTALVQPVCARLALAVTEFALPAWGSPDWAANVDPHDTELAFLFRVVEDYRAWVAEPSPASVKAVLAHAMGRSWSGLTADVAVELISVASQPPNPGARSQFSRERETARSAALVAEAVVRTLEWETGDKKRADALLRAAVREATIPWLLHGSSRS